jgi:hypothetical protein
MTNFHMPRFISLFLALVLTSTLTYSQKGQIRGTISDAEGPLFGASIIVTSLGTATDLYGDIHSHWIQDHTRCLFPT